MTDQCARHIDRRRAAAARNALLAWYELHRRDLPWRRDPDPYRVWVSEVMLQQTRVEAVVPYFERWLIRFPTLCALADASSEEVLGAWAGLGYYRRARALHRAAGMVRDRLAGRLPETVEGLRALPGVGPYTAGAIASIAFGRPAPAVDGNTWRVLARIFDLPDPRPAELEALAAALVEGPRPGDLNQALMELGATVCRPRAPSCRRCPLEQWCRARARGTVLERPARIRRSAPPRYRVGTAVVVTGGSALVGRRPPGGLLGGMWEFPGARARRESPAAAAARVARALGVEAPPRESPRRKPPFAVVDHRYSHRRHLYHAFRFELPARGAPRAPVPRPVAGAARWTELSWRDLAAVEALPMGAAQRRIARALAEVR